MKKFREYHLLKILYESEKVALPMDAFLRRYFRDHKAVGSKDRQEICETLYGMIRWRGLTDAYSLKPLSWENRVVAYRSLSSKDSSKLPLHVQISFPKFLFQRLVKAYGEKKAIGKASTTSLHVNTQNLRLLLKRELIFLHCPNLKRVFLRFKMKGAN